MKHLAITVMLLSAVLCQPVWAVDETAFDPNAYLSSKQQPLGEQSKEIRDLIKKAEQGDDVAQYTLGVRYETGQGVAQDDKEAVKWYTKAAEQGIAEAQCSLGLRYANGYGVIEDYKEAVKWLRKAAEQGYADAQYSLGLRVPKGNSFIEQAMKWHRKAAGQGYADAQYFLGRMYSFGYIVNTDDKEAVEWYRKAAEQGHAYAQYQLGINYYLGTGVPPDNKEAVKWLRKAAEQGNVRAQSFLGMKFNIGMGVQQDSKEAAKWYRKAAEQGDDYAQVSLGGIYYYGDDGVTQNYKEAVKWYKKAAEQGLASAQYSLARMYRNGKGVSQDYKKAVGWYWKSANQGNAGAQNDLGSMIASGKGTDQDYKVAYIWFKKAAEQENASAQLNLSRMYYGGKGVIEDFTEAYKWVLLASVQGDKGAMDFKQMLKDELTVSQITEGQRLAKEFKVKTEQKDSNGIKQADNIGIKSSGTGFIVSSNGYVITAQHVVEGAKEIKVVTENGLVNARLEKSSATDDIAILKIEGSNYPAVPVISSRRVKLGTDVFTIGFPNTGLQGYDPKFTKGSISSISGFQDDPRYFQISVPIQPGNSGGALFDDKGNVVGVIVSKLDAAVTYELTGSLPQNVNYAVKSSFVLASLEAIPEIIEKMKEPYTGKTDSDKMIEQAKRGVVLVLTY